MHSKMYTKTRPNSSAHRWPPVPSLIRIKNFEHTAVKSVKPAQDNSKQTRQTIKARTHITKS